ncbi:MAG: hypothetical protein GEU73_04515 [Chloroflexi bacterium]|nr:hypothetical protein [Chloroflexota bacterium]
MRRPGGLAIVALLLPLAACAAPPSPAAPDESPSQSQVRSTPTRLHLAIMDQIANLNQRANEAGGSTSLGGEEVEWLVLAGLTRLDDRGVRRPQLLEVTPSIENELWIVFPDGRMETTYRIRDGARWHDGTPFAVDDIIFTATIFQDRDLSLRWDPAFDSVESITAQDPRTALIRWKSPFIFADALFEESLMPRHILEKPYLENKASLLGLPYWNQEFVGTGAFRVKEFVLGSHILLEAFRDYALGRPKIDEIEVRFFPDGNALLANVLAGEVALTVGRGISMDQAAQLKSTWRDGQVLTPSSSWVVVFPQMLDPNPPIVANALFRRALIHGTDRQQLVDAIQHGETPIGDAIFSPTQREYDDVEGAIVRYAYEPARAAQMLQDLGYQKGADGMLRNAANQKLEVEIRAVETDINEKSMFSIADYWQRLGVTVDAFIIPRARARDPEYRATFPAFEHTRQPNETSDLKRYHSNQARLPENNFTGSNYSRYINAQWDTMLDRFYSTVPMSERAAVLRDIVHHMTENLLPMGMFHDGLPILVGKRVQNVTGRYPGWNVHEWELPG